MAQLQKSNNSSSHCRSVNESEVVFLFRATLQQIKNATEETTTVDINSIVIPAHFHSLSSTLKQAAVEEGLITEDQQATHSLNADRLAYDLDSCSGFKLPANETCDVADFHLVLVFNYEPERLSVAMVEVELYICSPHNFEHYLQFGEKNGSIVSNELCYSTSVHLEQVQSTHLNLVARPSPTAGVIHNSQALARSG